MMVTGADNDDDIDISLPSPPKPLSDSATATKDKDSSSAAATEEDDASSGTDDDSLEDEAVLEEDSEADEDENEGVEDDDDDDDDDIPAAMAVSVNDNEEEEENDDDDDDDDDGTMATATIVGNDHYQNGGNVAKGGAFSSNHQSNNNHNEKTKEQHRQEHSSASTTFQDSHGGDAAAETQGRSTNTTAGMKSQNSNNNSLRMLSPSYSRSSSVTSLRPSSPHPASHSRGANTTTTTNNSNTSSSTTATTHQKGGYQGMYRSAAAAHKHRQISIPPIGSPGLLMVPTLANTASIYPPIVTEADKDKWFVKVTLGEEQKGDEEEYILPSTVFRQSMIAGGYTYSAPSSSPPSSREHDTPPPPTTTTTQQQQQQQQQQFIERGSSTERHVGDMFDSDAGGLYLHFPELIPCILWERRFGDENNNNTNNNNYNGEEDEWRNNEHLEEYGIANTAATKVKNENGNQDEGEASATTIKGPKGARSSYIFFTNDQRPIMMAQFPGMRFTEQGIIMGERWRALTPEEKRPYENMALEDKERYAREMKEYIASVKKEVQDEKEQQQKQNIKREEDQDAEDEEGGLEKSGEANSTSPPTMNLSTEETKDASCSSGDEKEQGVGPSANVKPKEKGQRVVDAVILGLCKMLGENVNRREIAMEKDATPLDEIKSNEVDGTADALSVPTTATAATTTDDSTATVNNDCNPNNDKVTPSRPRRVSPPDLTVDELPQFTPHPSQPRTRPRPRPYAPLSFLDMIPISLTSTYPPAYVEKRRAYATAVKDREHAIVEAQEAKDDYDDAHEKYVAHVEAWDRMLEYQKVQIAKREAEAKREREEEILQQLEDGVGTIIHRPTTPPPPEDPMDCMPPRPEPPEPARVVSIPDVPAPPSPPPVVEMDEDEVGDSTNGHVEVKSEDSGNDGNIVSAASSSSSAPVVPMRVPKLNEKLLKHLDPACFLPTMSGRYLGLLSNHISDPQFCGTLAPGIAGTTYGGGTGLATSYTGGGRGAMGLVSGPSRGGSMWQTPAGVGSSSRSSSAAGIEKRPLPKEKSAILPLEASSSTGVASSPTIARPSLASSSNGKSLTRESDVAPSSSPSCTSAGKRPPPSSEIASGSSSSDRKNKKQKRSPCLLTTGDRNTTATEIASGSAGPEFPDGWVIKTYRRSGGETIGKTDRFWFSPGRNIRFRARKHAMAFVEILNEEHVGGDEDKAAEIYRVRGLHF